MILPSARRRSARWPVAVLLLVATVAACSPGASAVPGPSGIPGPSGAPSADTASAGASPGESAGASPARTRPSSPAVVSIASPAQGQVVTGSSVHVVVSLQGATIVPVTTTELRPDQGHVHLYVDNAIVSMNYGLEQDLAVHPGTYLLKVEFVAADHAPFNPRVWSQPVLFTVN